jgi:phosphoserine aminotransferase
LLADQLKWMNENGGLKFSTGRSADSASRIY